jgi:hypothetical protein
VSKASLNDDFGTIRVPFNRPKSRNRKSGLSTYENEEFWAKLQLLADHIWETSKRLYTFSTDVIIDECMVFFRGRSAHTIKLKHKSIKEGFKVI